MPPSWACAAAAGGAWPDIFTMFVELSLWLTIKSRGQRRRLGRSKFRVPPPHRPMKLQIVAVCRNHAAASIVDSMTERELSDISTIRIEDTLHLQLVFPKSILSLPSTVLIF